MIACTFFGHRECYGLSKDILLSTIEGLIRQGIDTFYVGNQGAFDSMVYHCLSQLRPTYPCIHIAVVLAYLPTEKNGTLDCPDTMYPEIEGHPKYAIHRRNQWMISQSSYCICYVNHTWGGAYQFVRMAKKKNLHIINLGNSTIPL